MATATRPLRVCDDCGQADDHPRHVIGVPPGTPGSKAGQISRHLDCCAAAGCVVCQTTEAATKGDRGQALIDTIAGGALDKVEVPTPATNEELGING